MLCWGGLERCLRLTKTDLGHRALGTRPGRAFGLVIDTAYSSRSFQLIRKDTNKTTTYIQDTLSPFRFLDIN